MSEQITVVQPKVSTLSSFLKKQAIFKNYSKFIFKKNILNLMIAFYFAILLVPKARQVVITAGNPSGMAATARATAILK